jgi:hypothetical protein
MTKKYATKKELKKTVSYHLFDEALDEISRVIFPSDVQVGLNAESFNSASFVVSGTVAATNGITGSLTKLFSGLSYLAAGTNVTITSASNGQITITAAGGSGAPGGSDTQLQYNDGGAFGGISTFTWDDTDLLVGTTTKLKFRDAGLFVHSPDDGYLVLDADTRLAITGSGAVSNAISLITDNAAGGIDVDSGTGGYQNTSTGKIHLTSSINSGDGNAIQLLASAGGIQINAVGTSGEDVSIINTGGSINLSATEAASDAINIDSSGGVDIDAADEIIITTTSEDGHISLVSAHTAGVAFLLDADANAGSIVDIDAGILQIDATGVAGINSGGTLSLGTANSGVAVNIGHGTSEVTVGDNLTITGNTTVAGNLGVNGIVSGSLGLSGSLTRLVDGTSYLAAGSSITITSASNGQVTIASSGGGGGGSGDYQAKSANFTASTSEYMFGITTSGGALTGTLPAASSAGSGKQYIFKDAAGYAGQSLKGIHIATNGSEKIDGASAANILVNSGSISIMTDGSNWFVMGIS